MGTPMPEAMKEKGLINLLGENNCFLNVVIQALFHLEPFRKSFITKKLQHRHQSPCVYCSLEVIFTQYEFSDTSRLPATALRETMAILFKPSLKFQLTELDDAVEAFDAVLQCLHSQLVDEKEVQHVNYCKDENCAAHQVFGIGTSEKVVCAVCGAASEPKKNQLFSLYSYSAMLRTEYEKEKNLSFSEYLRRTGEGDIRSCPNECGGQGPIVHTLHNLPEVFTVNIAWDSASSSYDEIRSFLSTITMETDLKDLFTLDSSIPEGKSKYNFRGMVGYYGKHYIAYFYNKQLKQWYMYDDTTVKVVGTQWNEIQDRCVRGRLQPSQLFYELEQPIVSSKFIEDLVSQLQVSAPPKAIWLDEAMNQQRSVLDPPLLVLSNTDSPVLSQVPDINAFSDYLPSIVTKIPTPPSHSDPGFPILKSSFEKAPPMFTSNSSEDGLTKSFIFVQDNNECPEIDFPVVRTNWLYIQQPRVYRFSKDHFRRLNAGNFLKEREVFSYKDVLDVKFVDSRNIIITFYSGKEAQYIRTEKSEELVDLLKSRALACGNDFVVKR